MVSFVLKKHSYVTEREKFCKYSLLQTNTKRLKDQEKDIDNDTSEDESITVSYRSTRTPMPAGPSDQGATAILETETEKDKDAQAIFEKAQKINEVFIYTVKQMKDNQV